MLTRSRAAEGFLVSDAASSFSSVLPVVSGIGKNTAETGVVSLSGIAKIATMAARSPTAIQESADAHAPSEDSGETTLWHAPVGSFRRSSPPL